MNRVSTTALSLDALFSTGGILADRDGDGLPDSLRACLVVGAAAGQPEHLATMDLAARLGFESLAVNFPLAYADSTVPPADIVPLFIGRPDTLPAACSAVLTEALCELQPGEGLVAIAPEPERAILVGGGDAEGLARATRLLAGDAAHPGASGTESLSAVCGELRAALGSLGLSVPVEGVLARGNRLAEVRLRIVDGAMSPEAVQEALAPLAGAGRLACDVFVALDQGSPRYSLRVEGAIASSTVVTAPPPGPTEADASLPPLRSLAGVYGPAGFAADADGDLLPEIPRTRIMLPDDLSPPEAIAAAHLAARLGLETLGLALPLGVPAGDDAAGDDVLITVVPLAGDAASTRPQSASFAMRPQPQAPDAPLGAGEGELRLAHGAEGRTIVYVRGGDALGREAALAGLAQLDPWAARAGEPSLDEVERALGRICALADVADTREPAPAVILDETWPLAWEVDDVWQHFADDVLPALAALPAHQCDWLLDVRVSEPDGRRQQIRREMTQALRSAGIAVGDDQVRVLPAYRQGRAWLLEDVVPRLLGLDVATVTVRVQRFAPDRPCLELPVRWLQDLHPVDELVEERLGLPHGAVRFELDATTSSTYQVEARDAHGGVVWRSSFDVVHGRRPYLPGFPAWGDVHPPTGCVRLLVAGTPVVDAHIPPDLERAWNRVQELLLPRLREHIHAVTDATPRPERQPFFGSLTVDAWLSEEDAALGLREEWTSPLESLHEDLYFMLLDYCSAVMSTAVEGEPFLPPWVRPPARGEGRRGARLWTAPGLIIPRIHRRDGAAGRVRVQLTAVAGSRGIQSVASALPADPPRVRVVGLRLSASDDGLRPTMRRLHIALDGPSEAQEQARRILEDWDERRVAGALDHRAVPRSWAIDIVGDASDGPVPRDGEGSTTAPRGSAATDPLAPAQPASERSVAAPAAPWDRVLGLPEIEAWLGGLAGSPYARIFQAGRSAGGRPSYAVELTVPRGEGIWSRARLSAWKSTLLLNARHHGNEPSSTSALLRLAELLAFDPDWRRYLDRVNVVLIPCENPDGAALSVALQDEHPTWMLHAGRYNAAGLEFTAEYTNPHTRHTEALVLPALWHRWAPDITCDDHGFPSHEWVQPFSGHCNPWFQSHWIAQGLIYLIVPRITNPRYAEHARAVDAVRQRLVRALAGDPRVRARNSIYVDRYRTYLSDWLPEAFPAPVEHNVLVHTFDYDPDDRAQGRASLAGVPGAYPGVTTVSLITEVADETAQGHYMELCAHTHLLADRALLDYLYDVDAPAAVEREQSLLPDSRTLLRAVRRRPALPL